MFSYRLKELRVRNGLSQEQLAVTMGVTPSTVGKWERGEREPTFEMLTKLANYFGVSLDFLFGRTIFENKEVPDKVHKIILLLKEVEDKHNEPLFIEKMGEDILKLWADLGDDKRYDVLAIYNDIFTNLNILQESLSLLQTSPVKEEIGGDMFALYCDTREEITKQIDNLYRLHVFNQ